jgi:hypothetical protein
MNPNSKPVNNPPRSEEGLRRGGHTRPIGSTQWGHTGDIARTNAPAGDPAYTNLGSHAERPPKPLQPGASEGNPRGVDPGRR